jgi:hypothetical protein
MRAIPIRRTVTMATGPDYYTSERRPTEDELLDHTGDDGRVKFSVGLPFGQIACASCDGTYGGLNDVIDDITAVLSGCLSDINYKAIRVEQDGDTNIIVFEVDADISDLVDESEG